MGGVVAAAPAVTHSAVADSESSDLSAALRSQTPRQADPALRYSNNSSFPLAEVRMSVML